MKILLFLLITMSLYAQGINVVGTWKLLNKKHPFTCCGLVAYGTTLNLSKQGNVDIVKNNSVTSTTRHYKIHGNKLNFYLENKQAGMLSNFFMKHSSTNKTFLLKKTSDRCFHAEQIGNKNNTFLMCKVRL